MRQESDYTYKEPLKSTLKKNLNWTFHMHVSSLKQLEALSKQDQDFYNEIGVIEDENLRKQGNDMEVIVFYYMVSIFVYRKKKIYNFLYYRQMLLEMDVVFLILKKFLFSILWN